jgi:ABC-type phosphate transport system permease subunit
MVEKGKISTTLPEQERKIKNNQLAWIQELKAKGQLKKVFNTDFFTASDSRDADQAGILGGMVGSLLTMAICLLVSFPLAVLTAVYLEEFAPKNRLTDMIEVNINNLAAVPSIVFGLLVSGVLDIWVLGSSKVISSKRSPMPRPDTAETGIAGLIPHLAYSIVAVPKTRGESTLFTAKILGMLFFLRAKRTLRSKAWLPTL